MKRFNKYVRFWLWIDTIGLALSVILAVSYLLWGHLAGDSIQNLWSNLSIEVLGVWLSVRIIDFLLQRHRHFKDTRFHQLRILQYFFDVATTICQYNTIYERDVQKLDVEIRYFDKRWPKRQKHFYKDEKLQIEEIRGMMPTIAGIGQELKQQHEALEQFYEKKYDERQENEENHLQDRQRELKSGMKAALSLYLEKLEALRENIWEETHPDD